MHNSSFLTHLYTLSTSQVLGWACWQPRWVQVMADTWTAIDCSCLAYVRSGYPMFALGKWMFWVEAAPVSLSCVPAPGTDPGPWQGATEHLVPAEGLWGCSLACGAESPVRSPRGPVVCSQPLLWAPSWVQGARLASLRQALPLCWHCVLPLLFRPHKRPVRSVSLPQCKDGKTEAPGKWCSQDPSTGRTGVYVHPYPPGAVLGAAGGSFLAPAPTP